MMESYRLNVKAPKSVVRDLVADHVPAGVRVPAAKDCDLSRRRRFPYSMTLTFMDRERIYQVVVDVLGLTVWFDPPVDDPCLDVSLYRGEFFLVPRDDLLSSGVVVEC